jgi:predicted nucleic acid-binding protein
MLDIVALDTSTVITLISPTDKRYEATQAHVANLVKERVRFVMPAPVVSELYQSGGSSLVTILAKHMKGIRIEPLGLNAADIAGRMSREAILEGATRRAVKFDALIAAIAHEVGARAILTSNPRDLARVLRAIDSTVQVVDTSQMPPGTLSLPGVV